MTKVNCSIPGCGNASRSFGLCNMHYKRQRIHGRTDGMRGMRGSIAERLSRYTKVNADGCWVWTASLRGEYGRIKIDGVTIGAHRVSYEYYVGPVPDGLFVLHKCDVPTCINPEHLFVGTTLENQEDSKRKGRLNRNKGVAVASSKLTEQQVRSIFHDQRTSEQIASEYKINRANVSYIKLRKTWKHVQM